MALSKQDYGAIAAGAGIGGAVGYLAKGKIGAVVGAAAGGGIGYIVSYAVENGWQLFPAPGPLAGTPTGLQATDTDLEKTLEGIPLVGNTLAQNLVVNPYNAGYETGVLLKQSAAATAIVAGANAVNAAVNSAGSIIGAFFSWI